MRTFFLLLLLVTGYQCLVAQQPGDYRTRQDGCLDVASTWQVYNGTAWVDATVPPGQNPAAGKVNIRHLGILCLDAILKRLTIEPGATLTVAAGKKLIVEDTTLANEDDLWVGGELVVDEFGSTIQLNPNVNALVTPTGKIKTKGQGSLSLAIGSLLLVQGIFEITGVFLAGTLPAIFSIAGLGTLHIALNGKLIVSAVTVSFAAVLVLNGIMELWKGSIFDTTPGRGGTPIVFVATSWLVAKNEGAGDPAIFKAQRIQFSGGLLVDALTTLKILAIFFEMKLNATANNYGWLIFGNDPFSDGKGFGVTQLPAMLPAVISNISSRPG